MAASTARALQFALPDASIEAVYVEEGTMLSATQEHAILAALQSKDAHIAELRRSLDFVTMDRNRLQLELDDAVMGKTTLLTQYHDVLRDVQEMEQLRLELIASREQSERYSAALDDANKALTLQLDALSQQVSKCDAAEGHERALSREKLALEEKVQKLTHKNRALLDELKKLASEADEGSERHSSELQDVGHRLEAMHKEVVALRVVQDEKKATDLQLSAMTTVAAERLAMIQQLEHEVSDLTAAHDKTTRERDAANNYIAAQRDALESAELAQNTTEEIATNAATELQSIHARCSELQRRNEALQQHIAAAEHERQDMQIEIDDAVHSTEDWKSKFAASRREIHRLESQIEASTATYEAKAIQWQQELEVCQQQLSTQQSILTTRRELDATMLDEQQEQQTAVMELEDTLDAANFKLQKLRAKYQTLVLERRSMAEELRQTHVVHAAECRELQELSSTIAAGQSKQILELTQSQERLVGRLLGAEEEVVRLTERCGQLERSLTLREQDAQHATQQHAEELRRGQALCVTAREKERQDAELKHIRGVVIPCLEQRIEELTTKLDASQRRCHNLKERASQDAAHITRAKSVESEHAETEQLTIALREKVSALETALTSKREGLRSALEERSKLLKQIDASRDEVATMAARLRSIQRHSDDHQRNHDITLKDAINAKAAAEDVLETWKSKGLHDAAHRIASDIVEALRSVMARMMDRSQSARHRRLAVEALLHRVLDKYDHDVGGLQTAVDEACNELGRAQEHIDMLRQELHEHEQSAQREIQAAQDAAAAQSKAPPPVVVDVSKELRPACHNISVDILGISLDDLLQLQMPKPQPQPSYGAMGPPPQMPSAQSRPLLPQYHTDGAQRRTASPTTFVREELAALGRQHVNDNGSDPGLLEALNQVESTPDGDEATASEALQLSELMMTAFDRSPLRSLLTKIVERILSEATSGDDINDHRGLRDSVRQVLFGPAAGAVSHQPLWPRGRFSDMREAARHQVGENGATAARALLHNATLRALLQAVVDVLV